jgi:hypothetical protein
MLQTAAAIVLGFSAGVLMFLTVVVVGQKWIARGSDVR